MKKDKSKIPKGMYCYRLVNSKGICPKRKVCPYWRPGGDYDAYCEYLNKSDSEIASEQILTNVKTGEEIKGSDAPFPSSLLWDMVKECGINMED